eukprot:3948939-Alexandrium_andersonii.AAC.1
MCIRDRFRSPREEPPVRASGFSAQPPCRASGSARNASGSHSAAVSAPVRASEERRPGTKGGTSTLGSLRPWGLRAMR